MVLPEPDFGMVQMVGSAALSLEARASAVVLLLFLVFDIELRLGDRILLSVFVLLTLLPPNIK